MTCTTTRGAVGDELSMNRSQQPARTGWGIHAAQLATYCILLAVVARLIGQLWPYHVMDLSGPIEVITPRVISGHGIQYRMSYCKTNYYEDSLADVHHTFVDGVIYSAPVISGRLPSGCHSVVIYLPMPRLPPGSYTLIMDRRYRVNPVREVSIRSTSKPFEVYPN
jgi:hypothetical protein